MRCFRRPLWLGLAVALSAGFAGCARFHPQPLVPAQKARAFEELSLADVGLRTFLETNGVVSAWPREAWDLSALTLAAFYFHPDLDLARARWHSAEAGKITAGQHPNPTLNLAPRLNSSVIGTGVTPWILGGSVNIPIETMGKRGYRVAQSEHLSEMARFEIANTAWLVRNRVRQSLLDLQAAQEGEALLREQSETLGRVARYVERQSQSGDLSVVQVAMAGALHRTALLNAKDAQRQQADARGRLAMAIGVPLSALAEVKFVFADLAAFPTNLASAQLQRQALLNRADVLGALAEYAASEAALQLQIAKQYPDIHLQPGYELDQTQNKWALGVSMDLPVLNQNQGPIAEAKAKREEIAAKFNAVQSRAIGEIDRATAVYLAALGQVTTAEEVLAELRKRSAAMTKMQAAGEVDKLAVASAEAEALGGSLLRLKAGVQAQQALIALEDAVQSPVSMPAPFAQLETAGRKVGPP
jgi:outer membrane protein, heavy metal efflux system